MIEGKSLFLGGGILLLVALAVWGLTGVRPSGSSSPPLQTVSLTRGELVLTAPATGVVAPAFSVEIKSKASGEILNLHAVEGERVEKGDILIEIDPKIEESAVRRARADLLAAAAGVKKGEILLERARLARSRSERLHAEGFLADREQEEARQEEGLREADLAMTQAQRLRAKETLFEAEERLRQTRVVAPLSGVLLSLYAERGQIISAGTGSLAQGTLLAILGDLSHLQIDAEADETDAGRIAPGQEATVRLDAFPDRIFRARVARISPAARIKNDLAVVRLLLDLAEPPEGIRPGLTANAEIVTERRAGVLLLPQEGVWKEGEHWRVSVVEGETVSAKDVEIGSTDGQKIEILTALPEGTKVLAK